MEKINEDMFENEDIVIDFMDGAMSMDKRRNVIREFERSNIGIICAARVMNEGINIPIIDSECFVDPRQSTIDIVQCIGRSLRKHVNKKISKIIVPIINDNITDETVDDDIYGNVIRVLKSLSTVDEGIKEYFMLKHTRKKIKRQIIVNEVLDYDDYITKIDFDEWNDKINEIIWSKTDGFMKRYNELKQWIEENGKLPSKKSRDEYEKSLGLFCMTCRAREKKSKLSEDRIMLLNKLKKWSWLDTSITKKSSDERYNELKIWIDKHNTIPKQSSTDPIENKLATFCCNQRRSYKNGKLSNEQIKLFEEFPFWYWKQEDSFYEKYEELKKWIIVYGKIPTKHSSDEKEKSLAWFCGTRRKEKKNGKLDKNKIKLLEKLPYWFWGQEDLFYERYEELKQWIIINGKIPSSKSVNQPEKSLGKFCDNCRIARKNKKLLDNRIKLLEKLPHWIWYTEEVAIKQSFNKTYIELKKWIIKNSRIPSQGSIDKIEKKFAFFCNKHRASYRNGKLSDDKIQLLTKLPYWFWSIDDVSNEKYEELQKWIIEHNKLPSSSSKNQTEKILGKFCSHKRQDYKNGKLTKDRIKFLEKLPKWYWIKSDKKDDDSEDDDDKIVWTRTTKQYTVL